MATKEELIARLEELLGHADPEQSAEQVEGVKETYEALVAHERELAAQSQGEAGAPAEGDGQAPPAEPAHIESYAPQDEADKRFKQLLDTFNQKVNELRRKKQKEENDNLAAKRAIMDELRQMIAGEENIGSAFQRFNELTEKWKTIGPVPQQAYRELQSDYSHLRDEFFYHIRIYKELRDHDLKKNTALKRALIADMEAVQRVETVREAELLVKEYQEKWHHIGPVVKEEWEQVRDAFWNATRVVYDRINEHYKARRAEQEANLEAKKALVEKVKAVAADVEKAGTKEWKEWTEQVLELQNAWKNIGFATRKENERIWKEFREACNAFFQRKKVHFDQLRDQYKAIRERKQALLDEALTLKDSKEWKRTADRLKELQQLWKEAGSAGPRDEHKLWTRFREACDAFFQSRKATFEQQDAEQAAHVQAREAMLTELEAFTLTGDHTADLGKLREFSQRWLNGGRISPRQYDAMATRYRAAMDKLYGQLKVNDTERGRLRFQDRLDDLKSSPDGRFQMEREGRTLRRKIEELENELRQFERNLGMFNFKSESGQAMRQDLEKKMERVRKEMDRLRDQQKQLQQELR
ncbi:MAG: DUF349 domain-containing protein [Flavobacteriales bacterium]|nr:DUF349 domain-containing protein [Flavobacteriales bacterium]